MEEHYAIQRLDGYTDGKESWVKETQRYTREQAEATKEEIAALYPKWKLRIRKISRRR